MPAIRPLGGENEQFVVFGRAQGARPNTTTLFFIYQPILKQGPGRPGKELMMREAFASKIDPLNLMIRSTDNVS